MVLGIDIIKDKEQDIFHCTYHFKLHAWNRILFLASVVYLSGCPITYLTLKKNVIVTQERDRDKQGQSLSSPQIPRTRQRPSCLPPSFSLPPQTKTKTKTKTKIKTKIKAKTENAPPNATLMDLFCVCSIRRLHEDRRVRILLFLFLFVVVFSFLGFLLFQVVLSDRLLSCEAEFLKDYGGRLGLGLGI